MPRKANHEPRREAIIHYKGNEDARVLLIERGRMVGVERTATDPEAERIAVEWCGIDSWRWDKGPGCLMLFSDD